MMNNSHSVSGTTAWVLSVDLATTVGLVSLSPWAALYLGMIFAGAAVVPDMDAPTSAPARTFGPLSQRLSRFIAHEGARIQQATRTSVDYVDEDGHRTITHAFPAAVSMGLVIGTVCTLAGDYAVIFTGYVFTAYALRALFGRFGTAKGVRSVLRAIGALGLALDLSKRQRTGKRWRRGWRKAGAAARRWAWLTTTAVALAIALAGAALAPAGGLGTLGPWLGVAVTVGMTVHCCGDAPSVLGVPFAAPIKIKGRRWYRIRATFGKTRDGKPRRGFRVGGPIERYGIRPALITLCVLGTAFLVPPLREAAADMLTGWFDAVLTGAAA